MHGDSGALLCHLCIFNVGEHKSNLLFCGKIANRAVTFGRVPVFTALALAMNPPPPEKTRKPRTVKPYASKLGPKGPNAKNRPTTSAQSLKKAKARLTNSDWMEVYDWVDNRPHVTQGETVKHFATRPNGALTFDQGSLSRNLRKRDRREAEVAANPAALSSKRARIVTRPDVDKALWM